MVLLPPANSSRLTRQRSAELASVAGGLYGGRICWIPKTHGDEEGGKDRQLCHTQWVVLASDHHRQGIWYEETSTRSLLFFFLRILNGDSQCRQLTSQARYNAGKPPP